MGFIERVRERMTHAEDFEDFKYLWRAYKMVDAVGLQRPKVYLTMPGADIPNVHWPSLRSRLPNLFTIRPSIFVNPAHDYMLRDDGPRGLMNFSARRIQTAGEVLSEQTDFLRVIDNEKTALMFEEFPLTYSDVLEYPIHYRVHVFGGVIGCIQGNSKFANFWVDTDCGLLASHENADVTTLIPNVGVMNDLCQAAMSISLATKLPYMRIDFVSSTQGVMFRSFAFSPGDVRSDDHNWFYRQNDEQLGTLWDQADQILNTTVQPKDEVETNDNCQESRPRPIATPDDNA